MAMAMAKNAPINGHDYVPAAASTPTAVAPALEMVTFSAIMDDIIFPDGRASRACLGGGGDHPKPQIENSRTLVFLLILEGCIPSWGPVCLNLRVRFAVRIILIVCACTCWSFFRAIGGVCGGLQVQ